MNSNDPILINKLRDKLLTEMNSSSQLYDESDLDSVKTNDWTLQRFLIIAKCDLDNAFKAARDAMLWRKSFGVNSRTDLYFPYEFYRIGAIFPYCEDREDRVVIYLRIKIYKSFPKFSEYFQQIIIHTINKVDQQSGEKGFAMVWDVTGAGPSNWDLSMIRFVISSFRNYFPSGLKYLVLYGVPWIMNAFVSISMKLLPEESRKKIKFATKEEIFQFIEPANVPDFLDGFSTKNYREIPKGVKTLNEMADQMGICRQEVDNVLKHYEKYF